MKWIFKAGLLVALLAIPVLIYLFLQVFGKNYYSLPIYYQEEIPAVPDFCENFSDASRVNWNDIPDFSAHLNNEKLTVFAAVADDCQEACQVKFNQATRLANNYVDQDSLQIVVVVINDQSGDSLKTNRVSNLNNLKFIPLEKEQWQQFSRCELLLESSDVIDTAPDNQFILLDGKARIRGYYNGLSLEDIDRLTTEIRLLLYEYQHQT